MGEPKKKRATGAKQKPAPETVEPVDHRPETHAFAYPKDGRFMVCPCGAEQDLRVVDGRAARFYRTGGEWTTAIASCPKHVPPPGPEHRFDVVLLCADEVIDGTKVADVVKFVDLDIAFSPVLPLPGEEKPDVVFGVDVFQWNTPVDVIPTEGGGFMLSPTDRLDNPTLARLFPLHAGNGTVSRETLRVWRARYLLRRGAWAKKLHTLPNGDQQRVAHAFDLRSVLAMGNGPLARMLRGEEERG